MDYGCIVVSSYALDGSPQAIVGGRAARSIPIAGGGSCTPTIATARRVSRRILRGLSTKTWHTTCLNDFLSFDSEQRANAFFLLLIRRVASMCLDCIALRPCTVSNGSFMLAI